jgi:hypothetical protein
MPMQMVDSKEQELSVEEIIGIAGMNTGSPIPYGDLITAINAELQMPNSLFIRQGNTLFIIHKAKSGVGYFRALNADTARNFLENGRTFMEACHKMGFDTMATTFTDPTLLGIFRYISQNPPVEGMGYQVQKTKNGGFYVTVKTGNRMKEMAA